MLAPSRRNCRARYILDVSQGRSLQLALLVSIETIHLQSFLAIYESARIFRMKSHHSMIQELTSQAAWPSRGRLRDCAKLPKLPQSAVVKLGPRHSDGVVPAIECILHKPLEQALRDLCEFLAGSAYVSKPECQPCTFAPVSFHFGRGFRHMLVFSLASRSPHLG